MQRVLILGSTGSIGVNTLEVLDLHPEAYQVVALTGARRVAAMHAQCCRYQPVFAAMADAAAGRELELLCRASGLKTQVLCGPQAIADLAQDAAVDVVMAAIVGAAGLAPCLAAARSGKRLLLANKEALVVGGQLFMDAVQQGGATLLPIDSEHSAIFQSLPTDRAQWPALIDKIILTASGGPFRTRDPASLAAVTPAQACAHPNWSMGQKISVDSATMMNKALEVIEAKHLFGVAAQQIEVVIHPQSVIHSMVQFIDHSIVAQLGTPDMRGPIAYGLSWPHRMASGASAIDFTALSGLSFEAPNAPDHAQRYPGLQLAWEVLAAAEGTPAVLNAANEVAVQAFLEGRLRFDQIHQLNALTLERMQFSTPTTLAALIALDLESRACAQQALRYFTQ